tara:strand:+ start:540 stop:743 length:204 start_codon:yes stop_codon:yes gene_type:complete
MTPKEKAQKILNMHYMVVSNVYDSLKTKEEMAKESALISVNMILQPFLLDFEIIDHWKEVKKELQNL